MLLTDVQRQSNYYRFRHQLRRVNSTHPLQFRLLFRMNKGERKHTIDKMSADYCVSCMKSWQYNLGQKYHTSVLFSLIYLKFFYLYYFPISYQHYTYNSFKGFYNKTKNISQHKCHESI